MSESVGSVPVYVVANRTVSSPITLFVFDIPNGGTDDFAQGIND